MPIADTVYDIIYRRVRPERAIAALSEKLD